MSANGGVAMLSILGAGIVLRQVIAWRVYASAIVRRRTRVLEGPGTLVILWGLYSAAVAATLTRLRCGALGGEQLPGMIVGLSGTALRSWALCALGRNYADRILQYERHELVRRGPYRLFRHPLGLGIELEIVGLGLMAGNLLGAIAAIVSIVVVEANNAREERAMAIWWGGQYEAFRDGTWHPSSGTELGRVVLNACCLIQGVLTANKKSSPGRGLLVLQERVRHEPGE